METLSGLLAICAGNSPVTGEFPAQKPVTLSFDIFFDLHPNRRLSKQSRGWWFETPSRPLWRHCNVHEVWWSLERSKIQSALIKNGVANPLSLQFISSVKPAFEPDTDKVSWQSLIEWFTRFNTQALVTNIQFHDTPRPYVVEITKAHFCQSESCKLKKIYIKIPFDACDPCSNYKVVIWRHFLSPVPVVPSPKDHGWGMNVNE